MIGEISALLAALTWATALIMFKRGGEEISPMALNLFKNLVSVALLIVTLPLAGSLLAPTYNLTAFFTPFSQLTQSEFLLLCASGILGIAVADSMLFASLNRIGVTRITIVDCLYSPSIIGFSWLLLGEQISGSHVIGAILIVSGILFSSLVGRKEVEIGAVAPTELWLGIFYGILAIVSMAVGIVMVKPLLERLPLLWSTLLRVLAGSLALAAWMGINDRKELKAAVTPAPAWRFNLPGAFLGSYVSMVFWIAGFKYTKEASIAGLLNQATIIFALPLSVLFLGERATWPKLIGVGLAATGVLFVALRPF